LYRGLRGVPVSDQIDNVDCLADAATSSNDDPETTLDPLSP
jgi:hypothetical protein